MTALCIGVWWLAISCHELRRLPPLPHRRQHHRHQCRRPSGPDGGNQGGRVVSLSVHNEKVPQLFVILTKKEYLCT